MTFNEFRLKAPVLKALQKMSFEQTTPIQEQAIPIILQGNDIFGCAQTGTGKTGAFAIPLVNRLIEQQNNGKLKALILAPTRELVQQIAQHLQQVTAFTDLTYTVVVGGVSQHQQVKLLKQGTDIVIATPGRLLDLLQQRVLTLQHVEYFVLDEADRMLDMGFINDIKRIVTMLPAKRQTLFFSATVSPEIRKLSKQLLNNAQEVAVAAVSSTTPLVEQSVYYVDKDKKRSLLKHLLGEKHIQHVLVFTRTKRGADRVAKDLNSQGIRSEAIHGDKSQGARERALKAFKDRHIRVLVATDIASRGIDIDQLSHVINYEVPETPETYVHRIGRTGRAGHQGTALSFCTREERSYMKDICKLIGKEIQEKREHPFN